jgi:hypothetical protein
MATDLTDEQIAGCLRTAMPRTKCSSGYLAFARAVLALAAQQPVQEGADCDQAFEEHYKCSARDPSNAGDLAIWRAAWGARGADALAAIKAAQEDARRLDWIARQDLDDIVFGVVVDAPHDGEYIVNAGHGPFYGKTFRTAIDAAMAGSMGVEAARETWRCSCNMTWLMDSDFCRICGRDKPCGS